MKNNNSLQPLLLSLSMIIFCRSQCSAATTLQGLDKDAKLTPNLEYSSTDVSLDKNALCLKPYLNLNGVQNPRVNDTFTLSCFALLYDLSGSILWDYPSMNETGERTSEFIRMKHFNANSSYQYMEITSHLTISNALSVDSGMYTCTVPDSPRRINFAQVYIEVQGDTDGDSFPPPVLSVPEERIHVEAGNTLEINCTGVRSVPVWWKRNDDPLRDGGMSGRLSVTESMNLSNPVYETKSTLILRNASVEESGLYTCFYNGLFHVRLPYTGVYVFVKGVGDLFVQRSDIVLDVLQLFGGNDYTRPLKLRSIIPCLPTSPDVNVTLWKIGNQGDEYVNLGPDVAFDPTQGFILSFPSLYYVGNFECRAHLGNVDDAIKVTVTYKNEYCPSITVVIDESDARHVVVNSGMKLKCIAGTEQESTDMDVDWKFEGFFVEQYSRKGSETIPDATHSGRVVSSVTLWNSAPSDTGIYQCVARSKTGEYAVAAAYISILKETTGEAGVKCAPIASIQRPEAAYAAGQKFDLECRIFGCPYPVVLWRWKPFSYDGDECDWMDVEFGNSLNEERRTSIEYTVEFTTVYLRVTAKQSGYYMCSVFNNMGNSSAVLAFYVSSVPEGFSIYASDTKPANKDYVQLECTAESFWYTHVEWKKWEPNKRMPPMVSLRNFTDIAVHYVRVNNTVSGIVTFDSIQRHRSGWYECTAYQAGGRKKRKSVDIDVQEIRKPVLNGTNLRGTTNTSAAGDYVQLFCYVDGVPFPRVTWTKNYEVLDSGNMSRFEITERNQKLIIKGFLESDAGLYQCTMKNTGGQITANATLRIAIKEPILRTTNLHGATIPTVTGVQTELYCYVEGIPFPNITWTKDGEVLNSANLSRVEITDRNQRLTIGEILQDHAGFYQCTVENEGGQLTANATLYVSSGDTESGLTDGAIVAVSISVLLSIVLVLVSAYLLRRNLQRQAENRELEIVFRNKFERGNIDKYNPRLPIEDQTDLLPYDMKWEFNEKRLLLVASDDCRTLNNWYTSLGLPETIAELDKENFLHYISIHPDNARLLTLFQTCYDTKSVTLGEGEFGKVVKAEAIGLKECEATSTVAVKMLKERPLKVHKEALVSELKILAHVGRHINIVNFLGGVTRHLRHGRLFIIMEYCLYGSLERFLRKRRKSFINQLDPENGQIETGISTPADCSEDYSTNKIPPFHCSQSQHDEETYSTGPSSSFTTNLPSSSICDSCRKKSFSMSPASDERRNKDDTSTKTESITTHDLLTYSYQCARGMEYLASKKVIHRDLAARNVLLAEGGIVKISDFGLARDCKNYYQYVKKKSNAPLPLKWMAIESIKSGVFSSKSDAWSFGVVLGEIFTLGARPYPEIPVPEGLLAKLESGYRMEKPEFAPDAIYQCMKKCWSHDPDLRPTFSNLVEDISKLLEHGYLKIHTDLNKPYEVFNEELFKDCGYLGNNSQNAADEPCTNKSEDFETMTAENFFENIAAHLLGNTDSLEEAATIPLQNFSPPATEFLREKNGNKISNENAQLYL